MAASSRVPQPFLQPVNGSGVPYPGAKLVAYQANTTTPQDTYTTAALAVANANPVIADADGRFPPIFLGDGLTYDLILKDANDTVIWTAEDVAALSSSAATTTTAGTVELATNAEALVGTDPARVPPVSAAVQMILQGFAYAAAGGTANALTGTPSVTPVALANGMEVTVRATATNTGAATLNWAATGVVTVKVPGGAGATACVGGEIVSGNLYRFVYSGADSCWIVEQVGLNIPALTEDTDPEGNADFFFMRDTSAGLDKKVKPSSLAATQAMCEAQANTGRTITPANAKYLPGIIKTRAQWDASSGTPTIGVSDNVSSLTDVGTGVVGVNNTTSLSTANYSPAGISQRNVTNSDAIVAIQQGTAPTASTLTVSTNTGGTVGDFAYSSVIIAGDFA